MNLTDLGEVLRDHAELPDSSHEARMAGVRARVSATRRRRAVAGAACVVLALVGIIYAVLPRPDRAPEPAVPVRSLPEYQNGTRLLAQAWGDLPSASVTVRFVPKSLDLLVFTQCDIGEQNLMITITVNDKLWVGEGNSCGGARRPMDWSAVGVVPGQPTVVTLTAVGVHHYTDEFGSSMLPLPASGTFALGVGEAVPVSEYPFPPRPQTLQTLTPSFPKAAVDLRADPSDPTRRKDITVEWPGTNLTVKMNTPGRIQVLVNDVVITDFSHWAYGEGSTQVIPENWESYGLGLSKGQTVRITVIPERTTGDWSVTFDPR